MIGMASPTGCPVGCPIRDAEIYMPLYKQFNKQSRQASPETVKLFGLKPIEDSPAGKGV